MQEKSFLKRVISNRLLKIYGNIIKIISYPFHWIFPKRRFSLPSYDAAKRKNNREYRINMTIWQTNFSEKSTLPVYMNFLLNRWLSKDWNYRYVSTQERHEYINKYATEEQKAAFNQLNDGAAQADFWRLFVLYREGGVYLDIDAHLIWPLSKMIQPDEKELFIRAKQGHINNYFIASQKGNPILKKSLDKIVQNIQKRNIQRGVFDLTGPTVINEVVKEEGFCPNSILYRYVAVQGSFTNEYFQYMDKPRGKWTHKDKHEILKPSDAV